MMTTSPAGRALITKYEGKRNNAYQDIVGVWTIGIGETGPGIQEGVYWSDEKIDQHFAERLARDFEPKVNALLGDAPTTQGQFDAMMSLAWNIGTGGFGGSTVLKLHLAQQYDKAADAFLLWDKAGGRVIEALARRREEEGQMYEDASP